MLMGSNDSSFLVFNFIRLWDGHGLLQWFATESRGLRKEFLAYLLSCKENEATLPNNILLWASNISDGNKMVQKDRQPWELYPMNMQLLEAVIHGNTDEFIKQVPCDSALGVTIDGNSNLGLNDRVIPMLTCMTLRGVTSGGDGVLHTAARHGHVHLVQTICSRAGIQITERTQAVSAPTEGKFHRVWLRAKSNICCCTKDQAQTTWEIKLTTCATQQQMQQEPDQDVAVRFEDFLRARNQMGETCLHEAARWGHTELVRLLVEVDSKLMSNSRNGPALVQILNDEGESPLYIATSLKRENIVKVLASPRDDNYPVASHAGSKGKNALHAAAPLSRAMCDMLLRWDPSLASSRSELSGRTPLHYLGTSDTAELIMLKDHTLSLGYCADSQGSRPIHVATWLGKLDVVKKLLEKYPDCDACCDASGKTFLHIAIDEGYANIVGYVCREPRLARILNARDHNGDTALHLAIQKGNGSIFCKLFGNKEVCLNFMNKQGCTPLDLALLSVENDVVGYRKVNRQWILNDMLAAGATVSAFNLTTLSKNGISDVKDESERLTKSAGLLAAAALLIVTVSFNVPFNMADKKFEPNGTGGKNMTAVWETPKSTSRGQMFRLLFQANIASMMFAAFAIIFCTLAGLPSTRHLETRFIFLIAGGAMVLFAAASLIQVFAAGLSMVYPDKTAVLVVNVVFFCCFMLYAFWFAYETTSPGRIISPAWARCRRLGFRAWGSTLLHLCPGQSKIPLSHVMLFMWVWPLLVLITISSFSAYKNFVRLAAMHLAV